MLENKNTLWYNIFQDGILSGLRRQFISSYYSVVHGEFLLLPVLRSHAKASYCRTPNGEKNTIFGTCLKIWVI